MGVEIMADEEYAIMYCNTGHVAFGPLVSAPGEFATVEDHREVANRLIRESPKDIRSLWANDPERVHDMYQNIRSEMADAESEGMGTV